MVVGNAKFELSPVMITNIRCPHIINNMRILNASPGFGTQLTEVEIKNFLGDSKLKIHLGTVDNKGDPSVLNFNKRKSYQNKKHLFLYY
jgi:hypothetical protein